MNTSLRDHCLQLRFNESTYRERELLPLPVSWSNQHFYERISQEQTELYSGALKSLETGLLLLNSRAIGQSHALLTQAIEVTCKAVLDDFKSRGMSAWMQAHRGLAQNLPLKPEMPEDRKISEMIERKALKAVLTETNGFLALNDSLVHSQFGRTRNEIIHRGPKHEKRHHYLREILTVLLPLLDEMYFKVFRMPISEFIGPGISRELINAARFLLDKDFDPKVTEVALSPFRAAFHGVHQGHDFIGVIDEITDDGIIWYNTDQDQQEIVERSCLKHLTGTVIGTIFCSNDDFVPDEARTLISCKICSGNILIGVEMEDLPDACFTNGILPNELPISSLCCQQCHLLLTDKHKDLIRIHFGVFNQELVGESSWQLIEKNLKGFI